MCVVFWENPVFGNIMSSLEKKFVDRRYKNCFFFLKMKLWIRKKFIYDTIGLSLKWLSKYYELAQAKNFSDHAGLVKLKII